MLMEAMVKDALCQLNDIYWDQPRCNVGWPVTKLNLAVAVVNEKSQRMALLSVQMIRCKKWKNHVFKTKILSSSRLNSRLLWTEQSTAHEGSLQRIHYGDDDLAATRIAQLKIIQVTEFSIRTIDNSFFKRIYKAIQNNQYTILTGLVLLAVEAVNKVFTNG